MHALKPINCIVYRKCWSRAATFCGHWILIVTFWLYDVSCLPWRGSTCILFSAVNIISSGLVIMTSGNLNSSYVGVINTMIHSFSTAIVGFYGTRRWSILGRFPLHGTGSPNEKAFRSIVCGNLLQYVLLTGLLKS